MTYQLTEPVVAALVARLESDLPGEIAALNAEGGQQVEPPAQVLDHPASEGHLVAFPTLAIQDLDSDFDTDAGSFAVGDHQLAVIVFLQDADLQALARSLRRYVRAVTAVALRDRNLGPGYGTRLVRISYGPTLDHEGQDPRVWDSWVGVRLRVTVDEDG